MIVDTSGWLVMWRLELCTSDGGMGAGPILGGTQRHRKINQWQMKFEETIPELQHLQKYSRRPLERDALYKVPRWPSSRGFRMARPSQK